MRRMPVKCAESLKGKKKRDSHRMVLSGNNRNSQEETVDVRTV